MCIIDLQLLGANYSEINRYVMKGLTNEDLLIKCNLVHSDGVGYVCSEQCRTRQQIQKLYHENVAIYTEALQKVQWRWDSFHKENIDDQTAMYEKTFKERLIGLKTSEDVHLALVALEEKTVSFFNPIYCLIASMDVHQKLYDAVRMHLLEANEFFDVFEKAKRLMQEFLFRTVCVTDIDLVMIQKLHFNLKLRFLIPTVVAVKATACPFVIKTEFGPSGKRSVKSRLTDSRSICPLKRNVREFLLTNSNSALEADFSKIRLESISKDEIEFRRRMAMGNDSSPPFVTNPRKDVGLVQKSLAKIKLRISGKRSQTQAAATSVERKIDKEKRVSVSELLNYILVAVEIQFPGVSFSFYKKIKVPVAVVFNDTSQRPDGFGSAVWNLIVWLEEANKCNYQWDWPDPYAGAVQKNVSDADYTIDHQRFVETYLSGLISVLDPAVQLKDEPQKNVLGSFTDKDNFVDNILSVETFLSDKVFLTISDDLIPIGPSNLLGTITLSSVADPMPSRNIPKNLHAIQMKFLSTKLRKLESPDGIVTRVSFLKRIVDDTEMSFFYWFFYTCQAIGQNFGIKSKIPNWFGVSTMSVWHSNFVVGYIDEGEADALLTSFSGQDHLLLVRFSNSERQSVVIHTISGPYGPVQASPVAVGSSRSIAAILQNPSFTPNYKIITLDNRGQFVLQPILKWHDWVAQAVNSGPNSRTDLVTTARSNIVSQPQSHSCYPRSAIANDQIKANPSNLPTSMAELKIQQNAVKDLCDLLIEVKQSCEESDYFDGPATKKKLREILSDKPELLRLLQIGTHNSVTHK